MRMDEDPVKGDRHYEIGLYIACGILFMLGVAFATWIGWEIWQFLKDML
jgi:hypothetical protein